MQLIAHLTNLALSSAFFVPRTEGSTCLRVRLLSNIFIIHSHSGKGIKRPLYLTSEKIILMGNIGFSKALSSKPA